MSSSSLLKPLAEPMLGSFIVNLCALPSPHLPAQMPPPTATTPRFFVSRRKVEGSERYYMHAGFFDTLAEAEHWRDVWRSRYPNAFVSQLGSRPSANTTDTGVLSETETLRVLEVRAPKRDQAPDEHADTHSYTVTAETRLQTQQELSLSATTAPAVSSPAPVARVPAPTAPKGRAPESSRDLAAALRDLATRPDEPEHVDLSSTTGVRHLRIEFADKSKRRPKTSATQRRT